MVADGVGPAESLRPETFKFERRQGFDPAEVAPHGLKSTGLAKPRFAPMTGGPGQARKVVIAPEAGWQRFDLHVAHVVIIRPRTESMIKNRFRTTVEKYSGIGPGPTDQSPVAVRECLLGLGLEALKPGRRIIQQSMPLPEFAGFRRPAGSLREKADVIKESVHIVAVAFKHLAGDGFDMLLHLRVEPIDKSPLGRGDGVPISEHPVLVHRPPLGMVMGQQLVPSDGDINRAADPFPMQGFDLLTQKVASGRGEFRMHCAGGRRIVGVAVVALGKECGAVDVGALEDRCKLLRIKIRSHLRDVLRRVEIQMNLTLVSLDRMDHKKSKIMKQGVSAQHKTNAFFLTPALHPPKEPRTVRQEDGRAKGKLRLGGSAA